MLKKPPNNRTVTPLNMSFAKYRLWSSYNLNKQRMQLQCTK